MMHDQIYCLDMDRAYLLVDLNTLCYHSIEKSEFTEQKVQQVLAEHFQDSRPYYKRLEPFVDTVSACAPVIVTSFHCNYACEYCYQTPYKSIRERLLPEDIPQIYKFYEQYCSQYDIPLAFDGVGIIGGEPLLPENRDTIQAIAETWPDCRFQYTTNGTYIHEYLDFLLSHESIVRVSLDGTKETHYSRRKTKDPTAYDKAIEGIRILVERGQKIVIITVFSAKNISDYPRFFDLLEGLGWLHKENISLGFIPEIGCGGDDIKRETILENLEAYQKLCEMDPRAERVDSVKLLPGSLSFSSGIRLAASGQYDPYRCSCLYSPSYAFFPDGSVRGCISMQNAENCIGRFLPEITINTQYIDKLAQRRVDRIEACKDCKHSFLCKGGCPATAEKKTGIASATYCGFWKEGNFLSYYETIMGCRK